MIFLDVWLTHPDGEQVKAGEMAVQEPETNRGGAMEGEFRYTLDYLNSAKAFPLDPVSLPLDRRVFQASNPQTGIHQVFDDSLPDDWGRQLLIRRYNLSKGQHRSPHLLPLLGRSALGGLRYTGKAHQHEESQPATINDLAGLLRAAEKHEQGIHEHNDELQLLFQAGSSPGGARPKAIIEDEGKRWIAKFPSRRDRHDVVRLEAATLKLAKQCGMQVPTFKVISTAVAPVLLVERFDISHAGGRKHMVSLQTLLQAENYYNCAYHEIADVLREVSDHPKQDLIKNYQWMVFNTAIGNTDDHLKNLMMQHDEQGWQLTPFYDLVPNIRHSAEHVLLFNGSFYPPGKSELIDMAPRFGLSKQQAKKITAQIWDVVSDWEAVFNQYQVPVSDIDIFRADINRRLNRT